MKIFLEKEIVAIPTGNQYTGTISYEPDGIYSLSLLTGIPCELYVLSDEPIKEYDWYLCSFTNRIKHYRKHMVVFKDDKKIIACTEKLQLPYLTDEFVEQWVNNPQPIIEVEYDQYEWEGEEKPWLRGVNTDLVIDKFGEINCRFISNTNSEEKIYSKVQLEFFLNDALNKALCQKDKIKGIPYSNEIAVFVTNYLNKI